MFLKMRMVVFALCIAISAQTAFGAKASSAPDRDYAAFFDAAMRSAMETEAVNGGVAIVVKDGSVVYRGGWGYADAARTRPMDPDRTLVRPASISKTFTWTAVMSLVAEGKLDLDADVNTYLTEFKIPETFEKPITLRSILTHTAGFEESFKFLFRKTPGPGLSETLAEAKLKRVMPPMTASSYSNYATALAGLIVANVEGKPFEEVIEDRFFIPLGMTRSTFREPLPPDLAVLMGETPIRRNGSFEDAGYEYLGGYGPAGGLATTAENLARWMILHLGEGAFGDERVLPEGVAEAMRERMFVNHPEMPAMLAGFYEQRFGDRFAYGHGGNTLSFHSDMKLVPSEELGIFVSVASPDGQAVAARITGIFADWYEGIDPREPTLATGGEIPEGILGQYRTLRRVATDFTKAATFMGTNVTPHDTSGIIVTSGGRSQRYYPVEGEERLFVDADDPRSYLAFSGVGRERAEYMYTDFPAGTLSRVPLLMRADLHLGVLAIGGLVALGTLSGGLWAYPKWRLFGTPEKLAHAGLTLGSGLLLVSVGALGLAIAQKGTDIVFYWIPGAGAWLTLSLLGALTILFGAFMTIPAWRGESWSLFAKLRTTATSLILLAFVWSLWVWNFIGPWNAG